MRVRCKHVDTSCYEDESITVGKEYEVLRENGKSYCIVDDRGKREYHFKVRFEIIKEEKVEEIRIGDKVVTKDAISIASREETFVVARILIDTQTNERVLIPEGGCCLSYIEESKVIKKPLRTKDEVVAEIKGLKSKEFVSGGINFSVIFNTLNRQYELLLSEYKYSPTCIYLENDIAIKYIEELNEIIKGGK